MSWYAGLEHIVRESEPLAPLTWLRIGGAAEYFAEPTSLEELQQLVQRSTENDLPVRVIGAGSQILVSDSGVKGLVIHLSAPEFCKLEVADDSITSGPGTKLGHVVATAVREGLGGLESLVGISGTFGGAVKGNVDSNGVSIGQWVKEIQIMNRDGTIETWTENQLRFSYRQSNLDVPVVLEGVVQLEPHDSADLTRRMQMFWLMKQSKQPSSEFGHARMFLDTPSMTAAELIEQAGARSLRAGSAAISEVNANYVVAHPGTTCADICELMDAVAQRVSDELGITLTRELQIW